MGVETLSRLSQPEGEKVNLDIKDKKILTLLMTDSRTPVSKIAKEVKLSRDAVDYRIKQLINKGVILGFIPTLHMRRLGFFKYHVFLVLFRTLLHHLYPSRYYSFPTVPFARPRVFSPELVQSVSN